MNRSPTLTWGFLRDGLAGTVGAGICSGDSMTEPSSGGDLNGVEYLYEPADDGVSLSGANPGALGVRADIPIGGHSIDGESGSNILACNFFPNTGDMIVDTGNPTFYGNPDTTGLRNALSHEHGHGMGVRHSCPGDSTKLMEPFITTAFDGPQEDDILAANRRYGDTLQSPDNGGQNDSAGTAVPIAPVIDGAPAVESTISIDSTGDEDWFSFTIPGELRATVAVTPTGTTYPNGPQNGDGSCSAGTSFNALTQSDLDVELRGIGGASSLASATGGGTGDTETISSAPLSEGAGTYDVRVFSDGPDSVQMYDLSVSLATPPAPLVCDPAPVGGCLEAAQAQVQYNEKSPGKEKMKLAWKKITTATTQAAFGDPAGAVTAVAMCVYDDANALVAQHSVNRGSSQCAGVNCWKAKGSTGYGYKDKDSSADRISKIGYKSGDADLAGTTTATIRMRTSDGLCIGATMNKVKKDDGMQYSAVKK